MRKAMVAMAAMAAMAVWTADWLGAVARAEVSKGVGEDPGADDPDRDAALKALAILGADVPGTSRRCAACHDVSVTTLNRWRNQTQVFNWECRYDDPDNPTPPMTRIDCMRADRADPASPFRPARLGIYAGGAHLPTFGDLFKAAYPPGDWQARHQEFVDALGMPMGGTDTMNQADFDHVIQWTLSGMPFMEEIVGRPGEPPTACVAELKPELGAHLARMALEGWEAKNRDAGLLMFGCPAGVDALGCLAMTDAAGADLFLEARQTPFGAGWAQDMPEAMIRILRDVPFQTSYWMRSSADGRFFANGAYDPSDPDAGRWGGRISDLLPRLTPGAAPRDIKVSAAFDPGFFPDNSGFIFQGTPVRSGFCRQSLLEDPATATIDFSQPECSGADNVSLYQAIGASLDGSDYMAITGTFAGDGGGWTGGDGAPHWGPSSFLTVVPIVNDGQKFKTLTETEVYTPWLGDWGLSPSNLVTASRVAGVDAAGNAKQMGYKFHFLERQATASGYTVSLKEAATVCVEGGKGAFSFDERLYAVYHYVDADDFAELGYASADDPAFQELVTKGSANVVVIDLATGGARRVTRMGPGQFAMFPHFRSDGWIYFLVYDEPAGKRYAVATDAGIRLARAVPLR